MAEQAQSASHSSSQTEREDISFARLIGTSIAARLFIDTSVQLFNPFLPVIAEGLRTDVATMGRLVSLRGAMGLLSPAFGAYADKQGYRRVLRLGLILSAVGLMVIGASASLWTAAAGMIIAGLGLAAFVPTLQAYVGTRLPYARRARGMGMLEYSWALTGIFGLSLLGQLIAVSGWRMPFFMLGGGMLIMALVFGTLPAARERAQNTSGASIDPPKRNRAASVRAFFDLGSGARSTYACIATASFLFFGGMQLMITYGAWLTERYSIGPRELGLVALLFGVFDLTASGSVSLFTDRFGKRRSVLVGTVGMIIGYALLPFLDFALWSIVAGMAVTRGMFEFAIVSNMPLLSEQSPAQRGKVMTLGSAISLSFSTLATISGPWLLVEFGPSAVTTVSLASSLIALALLVFFVRERGHDARQT